MARGTINRDGDKEEHEGWRFALKALENGSISNPNGREERHVMPL
jgi:hypothetical protein